MVGLFESIGDRSRRVKICEFLGTAPVGEVMSYGQLGEVLDVDPVADLNLIQNAVHSAHDSLSKLYKRAVVNVRGEGYRVVHSYEHVDVSRRQQRSARRRLKRAHAVLVGVDLNDMTPDKRRETEDEQWRVSMQLDYPKRLDAPARREKALAEVGKPAPRVTPEVAASVRRPEEMIMDLSDRLNSYLRLVTSG